MRKKVYLAGYQNKELDIFVRKLKRQGITVLVDIRELPLSRKRGFSKNQLIKRLSQDGIKYCHIRELGSPREIRQELRESGNYITFFKKYRGYIRGKHIEIRRITNLTESEIICLMCFEEHCQLCHRTIVADELLKQLPALQIVPI